MADFTPHDDETNPFKLAARSRWLYLARMGKEAWNTWATAELEKPSEDRTDVILSNERIDVADFRGFIFPSDTYFESSEFFKGTYFTAAKFYGAAYFSKAKFYASANFRIANFFDNASFGLAQFSGDAIFGGTTFMTDASFREATFTADADFGAAKFLAEAYFIKATMKSIWRMSQARIVGTLDAQTADINGHALFAEIDFQIPPDLTSTSFSQPPSFLGSTFRYPCSIRVWGKCDIPDGEARFRRLKQLAADTHDHELELRLFALETKAKRFHTLKLADPRHWPGLVLNFAYGWFSDFGQSVLRPLGWLLLTVGLAFSTFWSAAPAATSLWVSAVATGVNVVPFAGQVVLGREIMTKGLCPTPETDVGHLDCLTTLYTISAVEGVFGLIFLFLIGLGLRNRFRIK
ncbi:pentapeptide repeat-containing protein [Thalassobaculum salexigens]|uniref:pentapeptide repeat-containing protein n=1 Tax=Thalassobaculum salexigens TaxID=455360 RepID=UPI0003F5CCD2|nr:pentapeptide repeat-containing protein [Thalassobaculum salexigens]